MKNQAILAVTCITLCLTPARAATIAYDGFVGYGAGDIVGNGQGSGWSGNWLATDGAATNFDYTGTGLTSSYVASSGGAMSAADSAGDAIARNFNPGGNSTLWFSWLYQSTSGSGLQGVVIRNSSELPTYLGLWIGAGWPNGGNNTNLGSQVLNSSFVNVAGGEFASTPAGNVNTIIVRADINNGGSDTVRIWVNNSNLNDLTNNLNMTQTFTAAVWGSASPNQIRIYNPGTAIYDEFRVGTDAASVAVPEPSALGLLGGAAAMGLVLPRRRRV